MAGDEEGSEASWHSASEGASDDSQSPRPAPVVVPVAPKLRGRVVLGEAEDGTEDGTEDGNSEGSFVLGDEVFTEEEMLPAGTDIEQVRLPGTIGDIYTFFEVVHDPGDGRCVFVCEDRIKTHCSAAVSAAFGDDRSPAESEEGGEGQTAAQKRPGIFGPTLEVATDAVVDHNGKMKEHVKRAKFRQGQLKRCVVKVWAKGSRSPEETAQWLEIQLRLLRMERHPNICLPRRILEDHRAYYLEFDVVLVGTSLLHMILNDPSITEKQVKTVCRGVLRGLKHLHGHGLVHRDIKPDNVLLEWGQDSVDALTKLTKLPDGWQSTKHGNRAWTAPKHFRTEWARHDLSIYVRIIDMDTVADIEMGRDGLALPLLCGTPGFAAPEAYVEFGGVAADLWGVGMLLYLMVACEAPFHDLVFKEMRHESGFDSPRRQRLRDAALERTEQIDWDEEPWPQMPMCRDFCRLLLRPSPKARFLDAKDALASPWLSSQSSTALANPEVPHLRQKVDWTGLREDDGARSDIRADGLAQPAVRDGRRGNVMIAPKPESEPVDA
mmetsp:Transcript_85692/g.239479  ORF Transcript_85692/g.239479 Transcript_85692/m.239479 type:complete len:550 (+) Transcript_85692:141-1790(+)